MGFFDSLLSIVPTILGTVVGGPVGGAIGSVIGAAGSALAQDDSRSYQKEVLNLQNNFSAQQAAQVHQWNLEDWERNNAYNSPLSQKERLQAAGLNPLLTQTTNGLSSAVTSTPVSSSSAPQSDLSVLSSIISTIIQSQKTAAEIRNIDADTKLKETDAETRGELNDAQLSLLKGNVSLTEAETDKVNAEVNKINSEIENIKKSIEVADAQIKEIMSRENVNNQEAKRIFLDNKMKEETWDIQVDILKAQLNCTRAQASNFLAQAALANSQSEINRLTADFLDSTMPWRVSNEILNNHLISYNQADAGLQLQLNQSYAETMKRLGIVGTVINCVGSIFRMSPKVK